MVEYALCGIVVILVLLAVYCSVLHDKIDKLKQGHINLKYKVYCEVDNG